MDFYGTFDKCADKYTCFDLFDEHDGVQREQCGRRPSIKNQITGTMKVGSQAATVSFVLICFSYSVPSLINSHCWEAIVRAASVDQHNPNMASETKVQFC